MSELQIVGMIYVAMFTLCVIAPLIVFRKKVTWQRLGSLFNPFAKFGVMTLLMASFLGLSLPVAIGALLDTPLLVPASVASVAGAVFVFLFVVEMFLNESKTVWRSVKGDAPAVDVSQSFSWKRELGMLAMILLLGSAACLNNAVLGLML